MSWRWLIVGLAVYYPLVLFGGAALKAEYSHVSQYISELNATGSEWSWQIGYLGFLPLGLLGLVLLVVVAPRARLNGISKIGCWLLIAEPVAYVGSAVAPCDLGCPCDGQSFPECAQCPVRVITLLMTTLGLVFLSCNSRLSTVQRVAWLVLAATFITLYAFALVPDLAQWRGLLQRFAEGMADLYSCLCLISWRLLKDRSDGNDSKERGSTCCGLHSP